LDLCIVAQRVLLRGAATALVQQSGEEAVRQLADVFGKHCDDELKDEMAGANADFL